MVLLDSEGEKYACEQCIKGHRVSSCQHTDRPLRHVNKKGRPVSQCTHCRGLRKSRATHTRCNCGEHGSSSENVTEVGDHQCACVNGGKCTCAIKKEPHDSDDVAKIATVNSAHRRTHSKPHMANRRSEGNVPKLRSTFHPPLHRMNNSAHETGWPYPAQHQKHPLARSSYALAQRSVDSLPLFSCVSVQRPGNAGPQPKSEHVSPVLESAALPNIREDIPQLNTNLHLSPAALHQQRWSINDFSFHYNNLSTPQLATYSQAYSADTDQSRFSWTDFDFSRPVNQQPNFYFPGQSQAPPSLESVDYSIASQANLSRSVSGTTSEIGDQAFHFDGYQIDGGPKQAQFGRTTSYTDWGATNAGDVDPNRLSVSSLQTTPHDVSSSNGSTFNPSGMDTVSDATSPASQQPKLEFADYESNFTYNNNNGLNQQAMSAGAVANSPAYTEEMNTNWDNNPGWDAPQETAKANEEDFAFINFNGSANPDAFEHANTAQAVPRPAFAAFNWQ